MLYISITTWAQCLLVSNASCGRAPCFFRALASRLVCAQREHCYHRDGRYSFSDFCFCALWVLPTGIRLISYYLCWLYTVKVNIRRQGSCPNRRSRQVTKWPSNRAEFADTQTGGWSYWKVMRPSQRHCLRILWMARGHCYYSLRPDHQFETEHL